MEYWKTLIEHVQLEEPLNFLLQISTYGLPKMMND